MNRLTLVGSALILVFGSVGRGADDKADKDTKPSEPCATIDFLPLATVFNVKQYELNFRVELEDGTVHKPEFAGGVLQPDVFRDTLIVHFEVNSDKKCKWVVEKYGATAVVIKGAEIGGKLVPPKKVTVTSDVLTKDQLPKIEVVVNKK